MNKRQLIMVLLLGFVGSIHSALTLEQKRMRYQDLRKQLEIKQLIVNELCEQCKNAGGPRMFYNPTKCIAWRAAAGELQILLLAEKRSAEEIMKEIRDAKSQ